MNLNLQPETGMIMNAIDALLRKATKNPKMQWTDVHISVGQFDPIAWLRWMAKLGYETHPWGTGGYGQIMPFHEDRGHQPDRARLHVILMGALRGGVNVKPAKEKKLVRFFRHRFFGVYRGWELREQADRLIAKHGEHLPLVRVCKKGTDGVPLYASSEDEITSYARAYGEEWAGTKRAELSANIRRFVDTYENGDAESKRRVDIAWRAYTRALRMRRRAEAAYEVSWAAYTRFTARLLKSKTTPARQRVSQHRKAA